MTALPVISGVEAVRKLERAGWIAARRKGSHVMMIRPGSTATLSIPQHRELDRGTLRALIRAAAMTVDEFVEL
ncbi:MAG: type II toxin-antitoxin system HicA family toxin [Thermoleophilia bacterium]|nr:type II toxin-antitoxin system HicA family toxin [Thermoleophilia bacterium]